MKKKFLGELTLILLSFLITGFLFLIRLELPIESDGLFATNIFTLLVLLWTIIFIALIMMVDWKNIKQNYFIFAIPLSIIIGLFLGIFHIISAVESVLLSCGLFWFSLLVYGFFLPENFRNKNWHDFFELINKELNN